MQYSIGFRRTAIALAIAQSVDAGAANIFVDSDCSLIEAILTAQSDSNQPGCDAATAASEDTILLGPGTVHTLTEGFDNANPFTGTPFITTKITLQGQGDGAVIERDSDENFRLFTSFGTGDLTLENVTLIGGNLTSTYSGAGVYVSATASLSLNKTTITQNSALGEGGGIYSKGRVSVSNDSEISNNLSRSQGGGLHAIQGTVVIEDSVISQNTAFEGGGGISTVYPAELTVNRSNIVSNRTVYNTGGAVLADRPKIYIRDSSISGNTTTGGSGEISASGRVIVSNQFRTFFNIERSQISDNTSRAIFLTGSAAILMRESTIANNGGGALLQSEANLRALDSTIHGNTGTGATLDINNDSYLVISNSTISGNVSTSDAGAIKSFRSKVNLNQSTVAFNSGVGTGGVYLRNNSILFLTNSMITDSTGPGCRRPNEGADTSVISVAGGIIADGSCGGANPIALFGDTRLQPLRNNGGLTLTHSFDDSSIAFDAGDNARCEIPIDQRGKVRLRTEADPCDIGAVEGDASSFFVVPIPGKKSVIFGL